MRERVWQSVSGLDLERSYVGGNKMTENVPGVNAVYAWKRKFQAPPGIVSDPVALADWIANTVKIPSAVIPPRELAHFLHLHGVSVGGAPLTDEKLGTLKTWVTESKSRHWLLSIVQSISTLAPPLYVGEASNLARRVTDHLGDKTDFATTLRNKLHLTWQDCDLWYCVLPEEFLTIEAKARRTLIELIVARLTIAGCTSRPG